MALATKNGSLIVKSGGIAENCQCCGGQCAPVTSDIPASVEIKLSNGSQDQYGYVTTKEVSSNKRAIATTFFSSSEQINGAHTLTWQGQYGEAYSDTFWPVDVYKFENDSVRILFYFNSVIYGPSYEHWYMEIRTGLLRMVQEYGENAIVRTKSTMASSAWNSGTSTTAQSSELYWYAPYQSSYLSTEPFWRSSPTPMSWTGGSGYAGLNSRPAPGVRISQFCNNTSRQTMFRVLHNDLSMGVVFDGHRCNAIEYPYNSTDCEGSANSYPLPVPIKIQRSVSVPANAAPYVSNSGLFTEYDQIVPSLPPIFEQSFTLDAISLVYGDGSTIAVDT